MSLLKIAALGAAGFVAYRMYQTARDEEGTPAAFAHGHASGGTVRDAGPDAMRDEVQRPWTPVDQQIDESFPASDPPGNY